MRTSFESLYIKTNKHQKPKKKLIHFLISDIRIIDIKNHFLLSENTSEISKLRPINIGIVTKRYTMLLKNGKSDHFCFLVLPPAAGVSQTT